MIFFLLLPVMTSRNNIPVLQTLSSQKKATKVRVPLKHSSAFQYFKIVFPPSFYDIRTVTVKLYLKVILISSTRFQLTIKDL